MIVICFCVLCFVVFVRGVYGIEKSVAVRPRAPALIKNIQGKVYSLSKARILAAAIHPRGTRNNHSPERGESTILGPNHSPEGARNKSPDAIIQPQGRE